MIVLTLDDGSEALSAERALLDRGLRKQRCDWLVAFQTRPMSDDRRAQALYDTRASDTTRAPLDGLCGLRHTRNAALMFTRRTACEGQAASSSGVPFVRSV